MSKLWRVGDEEIAYVKKAIKNGLNGDYVNKFEENFGTKFESKYAIALNSGTSALHACLAALGIGPGDEVIVPPLTFIATAFAVLYVGAVPIFADVDPNSFNISHSEIEKKINNKTKAIITVSLYGLPPQLTKISEIAKKNNLYLIEDNAQCVLGKCDNQLAGTFGDASIFSLQRSKHLTTGDGGVVITNNEEIALEVRRIVDLGYAKLTAKPVTNESFKDIIQDPNYKRHLSLGYNFRMPEVCCAIGLAQLDKLDYLIKLRKDISLIYEDAISKCNWLQVQKTDNNLEHSWWTFVFKILPEKTYVSWKDFKNKFKSNGGDSFYAAWSLSYLEPAMYGLEFKKHNIKYEEGICPVAESLQPLLVQLKTNYKDLRIAELQAKAIKKTIRDLS